MGFQRCAACPYPGDCATTVPPDGFTAPIPMNGPDKPGMCWNAYMNVKRYEEQRKGVGVNSPALAQHPVAQANAASWRNLPDHGHKDGSAKAPRQAQAPRSVKPATGSITEQIFAACDAALATGGTAKEARARAIDTLIKDGVNPNSARKGSSMWLAARQ